MASYFSRLCERAVTETKLFAQRRLAFAGCMAIVIAVAMWRFGAAHITVAALGQNLVVLVSSYLFVLFVSFLWNFLRSAILVDTEQRLTLDELQTAENTRSNQAANRSEFADLMGRGRKLHTELSGLQGERIPEWDTRLTDWQNAIRIALEEKGFPSDYHEFMRAEDDSEPVGGIVTLWWKQENRRRKIRKQQQKLEEIVKRRLP
jgi:hypothetical protein